MEDLDFDEVIVTSSSNSVTVFDANTRKSLKVFRHDAISPKCLALLGDDYFIGAVLGKPLISAWTTSDTKTVKRTVSPFGFISALAATSNGSYVVASVKEQIHVWDVKSGEMLASFSRHYQAVTCLRFTSDDAMFLSGGKDGIVFVWMLTSVTSLNSDQERVKPFRTWNNHSKEVTDIFIGSMGVYSRVATSSADMTCKIYELGSGILLTTIYMDQILTSVVMDPLEYYVILGTEKGSIYKVNLYNEVPRELHSNSMENDKVDAHVSKINSLSISVAGDKLMSTSTDKTCKLWDMGSLSCLSNIPLCDDITNAFFAPYPALLLTREDPSFIMSPLERSRNEQPSKSMYKKVKLHHHPLTLIDDGSSGEVCETDLLTRTYTKVNLENAVQPTVAENLFQEAFKGETVKDVRGINVQLYTYLVSNVFENLESQSQNGHNPDSP